MIAGHRDLVAWQRAMDLAAACYTLGVSLRRAGHGALASQLQRSAISVPANIAEGKGRETRREYARFLTVALGSLREVETLLLLACRVGVVKAASGAAILDVANEVGRVTYGLRRALQKPIAGPVA